MSEGQMVAVEAWWKSIQTVCAPCQVQLVYHFSVAPL